MQDHHCYENFSGFDTKRKSQVFSVSIQNVQDSENYAIPNGRKGRVLIWLELSITIGK